MVVPDPDVFDPWEAGNDILIDDLIGAGVFITTTGYSPINSPDENGNVLIMQITSDDIVSGCLNFQLRRLNPDGTVYDPPGEESSEVVLFSNICFTADPDAIDCQTDFNNSGNVGSEDLLIFLPAIGCNVDCDYDPNQDGSTTSVDLLILLSEYGTSCTN